MTQSHTNTKTTHVLPNRMFFYYYYFVYIPCSACLQRRCFLVEILWTRQVERNSGCFSECFCVYYAYNLEWAAFAYFDKLYCKRSCKQFLFIMRFFHPITKSDNVNWQVTVLMSYVIQFRILSKKIRKWDRAISTIGYVKAQ